MRSPVPDGNFLYEQGPDIGSGHPWKIARRDMRAWWDGPAVDSFEDEDLFLIVLGEIDEVRAHVLDGAHQSPSALWAKVWRDHGSRGLDLVVGPHVALVFEKNRARLTVMRDVCGGSPAYISWAGRTATVGSDLEQLARHGRTRVASPLWMAYYLQLSMPEAVLTPFDGVQQVMPGHAATPLRGEWRQARRSKFRAARVAVRDVDAAADVVQTRLDLAVARRVRGAGKVAVALSGGIDSTNVLASLRRVAPEAEVVALAIPFFTEFGDERSDQVLIAEHLTAELSWVGMDGAGPMRGLGDEVLSGRAWPPLAGNWFFQQAIAQRAQELGVEVILDGEDADSIFGGSRNFLVDLLAQGKLRRWVQAASQFRRLGQSWRWAIRYSLTGLLPPVLDRAFTGKPAGFYPRALLSPCLIDAVGLQKRLRDNPQLGVWSPGRRFRASQALGAHADHVNFVAIETSAGALGLHVRYGHPFLDRDLVELAMGLPWWALSPPGQHKFVLRRLAERNLPEGFAARARKANLSEYFDHAVVDSERQHVLEGLASATGKGCIFAADAVAALKTSITAGRPSLDAVRAAVLALWLDGLEGETRGRAEVDSPNG